MMISAIGSGPEGGYPITRDELGAFDAATFWSRGVRSAAGCLEWHLLSGKKAPGYPVVLISAVPAIGRRVHRVAYALHFGEVPAGKCVCHTCDNTCCYEPTHLFLGTHRDNTDDRVTKNLMGHAQRAKDKFARCSPNAPFLPTDEAAGMLGVSPNSLVVWRSAGTGPPYRRHGRRVFYARDDLLAWSQARSAG